MSLQTDTAEASASYDGLNELIDLLISELGIPTHLKGFKYFSLAINIVYADPGAIRNVITGLYRRIADIYSTSVSCVERDMRTALKMAISSGRLTLFDEYFVCALSNRSVIPPRRFIAILSERLRCQLISVQASNGNSR
ncbi:MAG: sporulation initiation factor Spo0A C-terminal domain-containing protein [Clostridia bacterium]|nr:sporulation initiation factor Spo0A C-terminal domain-containing protein [Clostridia bacterium]